MGNCDCVITQEINGTPTTTSQTIYDGASLACITFSAGNVNDLATAIASAICTLQGAVAGITIDTNGNVLIGINTNCLAIVDGQTVTQALNTMLAAICNNTTAIGSLTTADITVGGITTTPNCLGITAGMTLTQMTNQLILVLCKGLSPRPPLPDPVITKDSLISLGDHAEGVGISKTPFISYVKSTFSWTDTSGGGVAKITLPALDYYVDDLNVNQASEQIILTSSADNYIYQDNTNGWVYNVHAVAIGDPAPTVTGAIICKVETGVGTIASVTQIIARYPLDNTLLQDGSVMKRNLNADTVDAAGAIIQNAGAYKSNTDGIGIEIVANKLQLKDDGVKKEKIDVGVAGDGLKQNANGSLEVYTDNITTETSGGKVQVKGAAGAVGLYKEWGIDGAGNVGFHQTSIIESDWIPVSTAEILALHTTPKTLLPTPGAGYYYSIFKVEALLDFLTTPYSNGTDLLELQYGSAASPIFTWQNLFTESASNFFGNGLEVVNHAIYDNSSLVLTTTSADPTAGDSPIYMKIYYKIVAIAAP